MEPITAAVVAGTVTTQEKSTKTEDNARIARDHVVAPIMQCVFVLVPFSAHQIMVASGPVEMLIGILVAVKPRIGSLALAPFALSRDVD